MFIFHFIRAPYNPFSALRLSSSPPIMTTTASRAGLTAVLALALSLPLLLRIPRIAYKFRRRAQLPADYERVLVLGASSGIGRAVAHLYAARGARVCLVGRREAELREAHEECVALSAKNGHAEYQAGGKRIISVEADFTNVDDMVRLRDTIETGVCCRSRPGAWTRTDASHRMAGPRHHARGRRRVGSPATHGYCRPRTIREGVRPAPSWHRGHHTCRRGCVQGDVRELCRSARLRCDDGSYLFECSDVAC
jgi:hypothetical protein